ncbi:MAG TPA: hypothetical protein VM865_00335, partial [Acidobacteriaceae bacterium]|nr:hypothetical protein [Acidobacteriaceae bacterium]
MDGFVLTTTAGQDVTVTIPSGAKVLIVPPGSKDLTAASDGSIADVQPGDRALVSGAQAGSESAFKATRVVLMKSSAIAQTHAAEEAAWGHGGGGIVKSVDTSANIVTVSSGLRTVTVTLQPATVVRRYAGDSVRFEDAKPSSLAAIHAGDQLRVRGTRAPDGSSIAADEIVTGTFRNFSGLLSSVDPSTGTVSLKDLATGKTVVVSVTPNSDVRRLPAPIAQVMAARMRGTAPGAGTNGQVRAGGQAAAPEASAPSPRTPGGEAGGTAGAPGGARRAGMDLSQMLSRLPTET